MRGKRAKALRKKYRQWKQAGIGLVNHVTFRQFKRIMKGWPIASFK